MMTDKLLAVSTNRRASNRSPFAKINIVGGDILAAVNLQHPESRSPEACVHELQMSVIAARRVAKLRTGPRVQYSSLCPGAKTKKKGGGAVRGTQESDRTSSFASAEGVVKAIL